MNNKDKIKALSTREQCRDKIHVWYGSADNYLHGLREVITNGTDEMNNNFDSGELLVKIHEDMKTITVKDTGRGMPLVGKSLDEDGNEVENYVLLFEKLFAGTNYENNDNGKITGGTNGVGNTVLNYTSDYLKVTSKRDGKIFTLKYENGGDFVYLKEEGRTEETGTEITFTLSDEVYTNTIYDKEEVKEICKRFAATNNKIKIIFECLEDKVSFKYESLTEYFNKNKGEHSTENFEATAKTFDEEEEQNTIDFTLCGAQDKALQETYLNGIYLPEQGTIHDGVIRGFRACLNNYIKDKNLYDKKEKPISNKDIEESLSFVCSISSTNVSYAAQTKFATKKELYEKITKKYVTECFEIFKAEQPIDLEELANVVLINKRANERAGKSIEKIKKRLQKETTIVNTIEKFTDCRKAKGGTFFIGEGDSAVGAILLARDADIHATYALKGKPNNILKKDIDKVLDNEEIANLIKLMECGIELNIDGQNLFDIEKLRFENIVIATDMDEDGNHIFCIMLAIFHMLTPELLKQGKIYRLLTPLFEIRDTKTDEMHYAYTYKQKDEILTKVKNVQIARCKGLGECDVDVMEHCIDPENPNFIRVKFEDAALISKKLESWMGNDLASRKQYIYENLHKYL